MTFFDKMCADMQSLEWARWRVGMDADVFSDGHADRYTDRRDDRQMFFVLWKHMSHIEFFMGQAGVGARVA